MPPGSAPRWRTVAGPGGGRDRRRGSRPIGRVGMQAEGRVGHRIDRGEGIPAIPGAGLRSETEVEALGQVVHAAADANGAASVMLVAQGVGQGLHRMGTAHEIPIAVEPGMDLDQRKLAMAIQDLETGMTQGYPGEGPSALGRRRQRSGPDARRTTTALPGHRGPQMLTDVGQLIKEAETAFRGGHHRPVEIVQLPPQRLPPEMRFRPLTRGQPRPHPVPKGPRITQVARTTGDDDIISKRRRMMARRATRPRRRGEHRNPRAREHHDDRKTVIRRRERRRGPTLHQRCDSHPSFALVGCRIDSESTADESKGGHGSEG